MTATIKFTNPQTGQSSEAGPFDPDEAHARAEYMRSEEAQEKSPLIIEVINGNPLEDR